MKPILIYHKNCPDGFGAAWSFWKKFGDSIDYYPAVYGEPRPLLAGREVYMVDFAYPRDITLEILNEAKSLLILDHHKTAQLAIGDLPCFNYDVDHSGSYLAWEYLFGPHNVPNMILAIEDRDLWLWKVKDSQNILNVLDSYDYNFELWDSIYSKMEVSSPEYRDIIIQGSAIQRYKESVVNKVMKTRHHIQILGQEIPAINTPYFQSETASKLAVGAPYSCAYYWDGERYRFSLRSDENGVDVTKIAEKFGGGGHSKASGFTVKKLDFIK